MPPPLHRLAITMNQVPDPLLEEIKTRCVPFCTALFALAGEPGDEDARYCGSGTFVTARRQHFVLTAAHVWDAISDATYVGIALTDYESQFGIRTDIVVATSIGARVSDEWGPDLVFLRIPDSFVARIESHKVFYDLDKREVEAMAGPPDYRVATWGLLGAPEQDSTLSRNSAILRGCALFTGVRDVRTLGDLDYVDLSVDYNDRTDIQENFRGMSGAGLWHIPLSQSASTGEISAIHGARLEGVAFYQSVIKKRRRTIRCHGRRTLYCAGLRSLDASRAQR